MGNEVRVGGFKGEIREGARATSVGCACMVGVWSSLYQLSCLAGWLTV